MKKVLRYAIVAIAPQLTAMEEKPATPPAPTASTVQVIFRLPPARLNMVTLKGDGTRILNVFDKPVAPASSPATEKNADQKLFESSASTKEDSL